jgi:hypothetical protein
VCRDIRGYTQEALHVGGNLNNGSNDGFFNWNVNNTPSNANWNIGSRNFLKLIFGFLTFVYNSSPLGENKDVTDCLRCCEKRGSNSQKER